MILLYSKVNRLGFIEKINHGNYKITEVGVKYAHESKGIEREIATGSIK